MRKIFGTCLQLLSETAATAPLPAVGNATMAAALAGVGKKRVPET